MNVDLGVWDKLTKAVIVLLLMASLLGIALWYLPLIQRNERIRREILALDTQIAQEEETQRRLAGSLEAMGDPRTIERLAREKLNYAHRDETVIRFEPAASNSIPPTPSR
jgi:cell division protein FtsB